MRRPPFHSVLLVVVHNGVVGLLVVGFCVVVDVVIRCIVVDVVIRCVVVAC